MNARHLALAIAAALALAACRQDPPPAPPATPVPAAGTADAEAPGTLLGRTVKEAIDKARAELATSNISLNNEFSFRNSKGRVIANTRGKAKDDPRPLAEITPQGDLLIDGAKVEVTPEQHAMLVDYRNQIVGIAEAGMAMGVTGAELGGKALSGVAGAIFGGKEAEREFEAKMEAEGQRMEAEGRKLCERMQPLYDRQQALAASLPAFKPYATMTQAEVEDCGNDTSDGAAAATPEERDRIREEIREELRKEVRDEIRRAMRGESTPASAPTQ